jgi:hypothetical protein
MLRLGPGLEKRQGFLFRAVDVALELFALTAASMRARRMLEKGDDKVRAPLARLVFETRQRVDDTLAKMWNNDDAAKYAFAQELLAGRHQWLEQGVIELPFDEAALTPRSMEKALAARRQAPVAAPPKKAAS